MLLDFRIGMLLGLRQIQHTSLWTTTLIITVITFTFLNLVVVSGILIGIVDGSLAMMRQEASGDLVIKPFADKSRVLQTEEALDILKNINEVETYSPHYIGQAIIEANYKNRWDLNAEPDSIAVNITGIDPEQEDSLTNLRANVVEGEYFDPDDSGYILIGIYNVDRYTDIFGDEFQTLQNIFPGDAVRVVVGDHSEEFIVKGLIESKADPVSYKIFIPEKEFRRLYERVDHNANQIVVRIAPDADELEVKNILQNTDISKYGRIETFSESIPQFIKDIVKTFGILGVFIGGIGIIVATITVFIVIFINILARRRQIGILKAIGITEESIEYAYAIQASLYACIGSILGVLLTLFVIVPYFDAHPIDFPYANVTLSISTWGIAYRCFLIFVVTLIAGLIPAWIIARGNTLNAILGRK